MLYIPILVVLITAGIILVAVGVWNDKVGLMVSGFISFAIGSLFMLIPIVTKPSVEYELSEYRKAEYEYKCLISGDTINIDAVKSFLNDIDNVNKNIVSSRKYHDHWFLSPFYYKEIADLETLDMDSVNVVTAL